jgi:hypothetical protein
MRGWIMDERAGSVGGTGERKALDGLVRAARNVAMQLQIERRVFLFFHL